MYLKKIKSLFIHIGLHRTATTALQYFFSRNDNTLKKYGILYPKTGRDEGIGAHHNFAACFRHSHPFFKPEKKFEQYIKEIIAENSAFETVLISSEMFSEIPFNNDFDRLRILKDIAESVKIIIYLRRQDEYLSSLYSEDIKAGFKKESRLSPLEYFELRKQQINYKVICEKWVNIFGVDNVIIRPFEKEQFKFGTIYSDFLNILDLKLTNEYLLPSYKLNVSLTREKLEYRRLVNILSPNPKYTRKLTDFLLNLKSRTESQYYGVYNLEERQMILSFVSESNEYIAKEYLNRIDGCLFYSLSSLPNSNLYQEEKVPNILSDAKLIEITKEYLKQEPTFYFSLRKAVLKALNSEDIIKKNAAEKMKTVLNIHTKKIFRHYIKYLKHEILRKIKTNWFYKVP